MSFNHIINNTLDEIILKDAENMIAEIEGLYTNNKYVILDDRKAEFNEYFKITAGNKYITVETLKSYTGKYLLTAFLEMNENYELPFDLSFNIEEMTLKIDISDVKRDPDDFRTFLIEFLNILYAESWR